MALKSPRSKGLARQLPSDETGLKTWPEIAAEPCQNRQWARWTTKKTQKKEDGT